MIILRIFIENEDLGNVNWALAEDGKISNSGTTAFSELLQLAFDGVEIYLAPHLITILKAELGPVSDKKINDELLLSFVEDDIAEDIENCKPILMRLTDGVDYVAILNRNLHAALLDKLAANVKQVRFIQPFPYLTHKEKNIWTVYLIGNDKFVRTSTYEYYLLDDQEPLPKLLEQMLADYSENSLTVYTDNTQTIELLQTKYNLNCNVYAELEYGTLIWNLYNEKSKRFNIKLNQATLSSLIRTAKTIGVFAAIFVVFWLMNLIFLLYTKPQLEKAVAKDFSGIVSNASYSSSLLAQVDDKLQVLEHSKGLYAPNDAISLFDTFLKTAPDVNNRMIQGIQYSGSQLNIFLNSQFNPEQFSNDKDILANKRIRADIIDYKTYQAQQSANNNQNNGGGVLSNTDSSSSATNTNAALSDAAWVVSLQIISRMDSLNDSSSK